MTSYQKIIKNSRIVPTESQYIENKKFNMELYLKLQVESNSSFQDKHRYIKVNDINYTRFSKDIGVTPKTLRNGIDELKISKIVFETSDGTYLKIKNQFEYYMLFDEKFIRKLLDLRVKNLIKVYLIYYSYSKQYGAYKKPKEETLKALGMCGKNSRGKQKLKEINDILESHGLIYIKKIPKDNKTLLEITAPPYQTTIFYNDSNDLNVEDSIQSISNEYIKELEQKIESIHNYVLALEDKVTRLEEKLILTDTCRTTYF